MDGKLTALPVEGFAKELASDSPAPGGGSAAALEGALGAGLIAMVCRLTAGKAAYKEREADVKRTEEAADDLRTRLLKAVDTDTEAFLCVSEAFALPKTTEAEKKFRSESIQRGLALCTQSPLLVMNLATQGLFLAQQLSVGFNTSAASDFGVAVLSLRSALQGAWLNVCINVGSLKDRAQAEDFRRQGQKYLESALPLAEKLYQTAIDAI